MDSHDFDTHKAGSHMNNKQSDPDNVGGHPWVS